MSGGSIYDIAGGNKEQSQPSGTNEDAGTSTPLSDQITLTISCEPNKHVQTGTYHFTIQDGYEVSCPVGESVRIFLKKKDGSYKIEGRVEGSGNSAKVNTGYIWTEYGDAEWVTIAAKGFGKWVDLVRRTG